MRAALKSAVTQITELINKVDMDALASRVIDTHAARFDPLPAQPLTANLDDSQKLDFHSHPEGILHTVSDGSMVRLVTADAVVTLTHEQFVIANELLQRTDWFRLHDISKSSSGDLTLFDKLLDARLICAASCGRKT